ncbi:GNAT family N-acetyltransferase [Streptacidiphilus fuscans]|uniref:GNAT family N-acetyltransferase n=1 Tax=Streptacidiphilus fuscans TaxID=2789292 RepID=A0A931B7V5_9ACTN|nr:GNAT family N-acetyltransferase [Streptacidiphilus fuscans]MBF9071077.1 GNAT family N-acetyltransferase [Streptacidiphilus fuscans]
MILRPVHDTAADASAVRSIYQSAFAVPPLADRERARADVRTRRLAAADQGGCWFAVDDREGDGEPLGVSLSLRREGLWGLALFAVRPEAQGKGVGRLLLDHALAHSGGCLRGMIVASDDPRAARRYHAAGFRLHPTMAMAGSVDRTALPATGGIPVHLGDATHFDLLDSVDRRSRGAAHGEDHLALLRTCDELLVADTLAGSGYAYRLGGRVMMLAATSRRVATALLIEALARTPESDSTDVRTVTAEQDWAVDVCLAVGLSVSTRGYLALRGMRPPTPYLPSGAYL